MKTNTAMFHLGGLARMSLAAAIAIGSSGATAYAGPVPSLPDGPAPTPEALGSFHVIQVANTFFCVQPQGGSVDDVLALQEPCAFSDASQNWLFVRQSTGDYEIINAHSGKCLYANGGAVDNVEIVQAGCNVVGTNIPASNALWKPSALVGQATLMSRIGHRDTGFCMDAFGNSFPGEGLRLHNCNGHAEQIFDVGEN